MPTEVTTHEDAMSLAILIARQGARHGHRPFGTVIVNSENRLVMSTAYGTESALDPTRHSEMLAIRNACKHTGQLLRGYTMYQTHEPCIMCCGAIMHSKLDAVYFGSHRFDLPELFRQRTISAHHLLRDTTDPPEVHSAFMRKRCIELFDNEIAAHYNALDDQHRVNHGG